MVSQGHVRDLFPRLQRPDVADQLSPHKRPREVAFVDGLPRNEDPMIIDPADLDSRDLYLLLVSVVVPRPIAWVTTQSKGGVVNLAPFSYFNAITSRPPMIQLCVGQRRLDGEFVDKDTLRNVKDTGELVVNVATEPLVAQVNQSSGEYAPDVSEVGEVGLTAVPSEIVAPPRIAESPVNLECKLERVLMLGRAPQVGMIIAEIVRAHVADAVWDEASRSVDPTVLQPVARLGGTMYTTLGRVFSLARPKV